MAYRDRRNKKSQSFTVKTSEKERDEIELAVELSGGEFSPSIREAALSWARGVICANRSLMGKPSMGVVKDDGEIKYCFG